MAGANLFAKELLANYEALAPRKRDAKGRFVPIRGPMHGDAARFMHEGVEVVAHYILELDGWVDQNGNLLNPQLLEAAAQAAAADGPLIVKGWGMPKAAEHPAPNEWAALDEKQNKFKPAYRPKAKLSRGLSCGVGNFVGFYYGGNGETYFKDLLYFFKQHWENNKTTIYSRKGNFLPCATVFWSDHPGGSGENMADYITAQFPDTPVVKQPGVNPQSGKKLVTCMWTPNAEQVVAHPFWSEIVIGHNDRMPW